VQHELENPRCDWGCDAERTEHCNRIRRRQPGRPLASGPLVAGRLCRCGLLCTTSGLAGVPLEARAGDAIIGCSLGVDCIVLQSKPMLCRVRSPRNGAPKRQRPSSLASRGLCAPAAPACACLRLPRRSIWAFPVPTRPPRLAAASRKHTKLLWCLLVLALPYTQPQPPRRVDPLSLIDTTSALVIC